MKENFVLVIIILNPISTAFALQYSVLIEQL